MAGKRAASTRAPAAPTEAAATAGRAAARALAGGRLSLDTPFSWYGAFNVVVPPRDADTDWSLLNLDAAALRTMRPQRLMELLADLSPELSRALYDFLRLCNAGWEIEARRPGSDTPDAQGQAAIDAFIDRLHDLHGSADVVFNRLFIGAFLRGAFVGELVLDDARQWVDLATPDPAAFVFQRVSDPVRGAIWNLAQWQGGTLVVLDRPTIRYVPVDPFPGSPYGRPLASPALFTSLFLLGLLHDLRRVVSQQGYPRLDLLVNLELLKNQMPANLSADPKAFQDWAGAIFSEVKAAYSQLKPDDAYVHSEVVSVNRPVGAVDASSLGAVDGLVTALERMSIRALKTMPFMLALSESTTETQANRQWEVMAAGIKSLQHLCENLLSTLLQLGLQAQGIACDVECRFAELRAAEEMRDAQTLRLKLGNIALMQARGYIDQDEAGDLAIGHPPAVPEPPYPTAGVQGASSGGPGSGAALTGLDAQNPEPGVARMVPADDLEALLLDTLTTNGKVH